MVDGRQPFSPEVGREPRKVAHHADDLVPARLLPRTRLVETKHQTERIRFLQIHLDEAAVHDDVRSAEVGGGEGAPREHLHAIGLEEIDADPRRVRQQGIGDAHVRNVLRPCLDPHPILEADQFDRRRARHAGRKRHAGHHWLGLELREELPLLCDQAVAIDLRRVRPLRHDCGDDGLGRETSPHELSANDAR